MTLTARQKKNTMKDYQRHTNDSGSAEVQIALFTRKIEELVKHLKSNPKDNHSRKGLLGMIAQRKKLLKHLKSSDEEKYLKVTKKLDLKA
ncbi:MAG TPA: 30S ribosomal protein S15 [Candidatus Moranbacteria bacterium]|nr:30S ribosomal protein S15 [Candidatus Moranbacteria bacterium]